MRWRTRLSPFSNFGAESSFLKLSGDTVFYYYANRIKRKHSAEIHTIFSFFRRTSNIYRSRVRSCNRQRKIAFQFPRGSFSWSMTHWRQLSNFNIVTKLQNASSLKRALAKVQIEEELNKQIYWRRKQNFRSLLRPLSVRASCNQYSFVLLPWFFSFLSSFLCLYVEVNPTENRLSARHGLSH